MASSAKLCCGSSKPDLEMVNPQRGSDSGISNSQISPIIPHTQASSAGGSQERSTTDKLVDETNHKDSSVAIQAKNEQPTCCIKKGPTPQLVVPQKTFYRRELPSPICIGLSSPSGRSLFTEALLAGGMETFFPLSEQFHTQNDPAFCGLGTLVMVLNALAIDPRRIWKGSWRWFHEEMLDCCEPLDVVRKKGITLGKLQCLAECNGARASLRYAESSSIEEFRQAVLLCTTGNSKKEEADGPSSVNKHQEMANPPASILIVSYDRRVLGQTGSGHFSPIGGYHGGKDMVLIMDVARFKYPPHWVRLEKMWEAMQNVDPETGRSRGYLVAQQRVGDSLAFAPPVLFTIDRLRYKEFDSFANSVMAIIQTVMERFKDKDLSNTEVLEPVILCICEAINAKMLSMLTSASAASKEIKEEAPTFTVAITDSQEEGDVRLQILLAVMKTSPVFTATDKVSGIDSIHAKLALVEGAVCCGNPEICRALVVILVMTVIELAHAAKVNQEDSWIYSGIDPVLKNEVGDLKHKLRALLRPRQ